MLEVELTDQQKHVLSICLCWTSIILPHTPCWTIALQLMYCGIQE